MIPNSIYNNNSGFTHDYYSGTTALSTDPIRCLGITAAAWATGGPVSKPIIDVTTPGSDTAAPTTIASVSPQANSYGWNNSDVTVGLLSADGEGSGVKQVTYSVSGAQPLPAATVAGSTASVLIAAEGVSTITFSAVDNAGNVELAHAVTVKLDKTAPGFTAPHHVIIQQTSGAGAVVSYPLPEIVETGSGLSVATCAPLSGSTFPVGVTTVTCTASDRADNVGSTQFNVTVTPTSSPDGVMFGAGIIVQRKMHHHFLFRVAQRGNQDDGRFTYRVNPLPRRSPHDDARHGRNVDDDHDCDRGPDHHHAPDRFEATSISSVVFSGNPRLRSKGGFKKVVESVSFSGSGTWNGQPGHTFEVSAVDGRKSDTFSMVISNPLGQVVASVAATLDGGTIHATRAEAVPMF